MQSDHSRGFKAAMWSTGVCALATAGTVNAADFGDPKFGVFAEVGTLGLGAGVAGQFNEHFSARAGYSRISGDLDDYEAEDLEFDADATFGAAKLLFDWYPKSQGKFRVTAGAMLNDSKFVGVANTTGGGYIVNDTFYPASQVGTIGGRLDFDRFAPYIGFGFGRALDTAGRFNVLVDFGALITEPDVSIVATCGPAISATRCTQLQSDIRAEQDEIEDDIDDIRLWPHVAVSFSWRF
jgi:hypothetical protein